MTEEAPPLREAPGCAGSPTGCRRSADGCGSTARRVTGHESGQSSRARDDRRRQRAAAGGDCLPHWRTNHTRRLTAGVCLFHPCRAFRCARRDGNRPWLRRPLEQAAATRIRHCCRTGGEDAHICQSRRGGPREWGKGEQRDGTGNLGSVPRRRAYRIPQPRSGGSGYCDRCSGADIR